MKGLKYRCWALLLAVGCSLAPAVAQQKFRVMEYNVENLFDCQHDSLKNDYEFLPDNPKGWNLSRFYDKLNKIGKVILAAGEDQVPDLVGLCEVENEHCVQQLVTNSPLREANYRYAMTESPMSSCCTSRKRSGISVHRRSAFLPRRLTEDLPAISCM